MTRLYCIILIILLVGICLVPITASADSLPWVRIVDQDTPLYTNASTTKITCMLHLSYYLYVLDTVDNYYLVELMDNTTGYPKIVGYVSIDSVELCTEYPTLPYYPQVNVTVSSGSASVRLSPLDSASELICATNAQTMSYYGYIDSSGTRWYYVYFYGTFGYVSSQYVVADNISLHPTPLVEDTITEEPEEDVTDTIAPTDDPETDTTIDTTTYTTTSEILLIIFVSLLSIGLVVALFSPKTKSTSTDKIWDKHI